MYYKYSLFQVCNSLVKMFHSNRNSLLFSTLEYVEPSTDNQLTCRRGGKSPASRQPLVAPGEASTRRQRAEAEYPHYYCFADEVQLMSRREGGGRSRQGSFWTCWWYAAVPIPHCDALHVSPQESANDWWRGCCRLQHAAEVLLLLQGLREQRWCVSGKVPTDVHPAELDLLGPYK